MVTPAPTAGPAAAASDAPVQLPDGPPAVRRRRRAAPAAEPLGSLLAPGVVRAVCPACGGEQLTELSMMLTDGTQVRFTSCRGCEHRRWESAESTLTIGEVLERARA